MNKQGKRTGADGLLRIEGGKFLKSLRNNSGLTQKELADKLQLNYYTMISQIEAGSARVPPNLFVAYGKALGVDPILFTKKLMQYYDRYTYTALFGNKFIELEDLI
jgi:transcriptional regulator with XRE-family HTH domain|tara:strand:- start:774 stop:1091 length:318 start_codon:yes stop_codon:yes gene_type:complete